MRGAVVAIALVTSACISGVMRPGKSVSVKTMQQEAARLPELVQRLIDQGATEKAFFVLEAYKTRPYAGAQLTAGAQKVHHGDLRPLFASLFRKPDDMVASRGLRIVPKDDAQSQLLTLQALQREGAYWHHLASVEKRFVDKTRRYGRIIRNTFATVSSMEAAVLFDDDDVFVSYFVHGERVHAFTMRAGALTHTELEASLSEIESQSHLLIGAVSKAPATADDERWIGPARALHSALIAPLEAVRGATALYVSTDGTLASIPFEVLIDKDGEPLIGQARVTYLHSATVLRYLLQRPILDAPPRFLAIGNPVYPEGVPELPGAAKEAETLSLVFDGSEVLIGSDASEDAVIDKLASSNILHFATHGVLLGTDMPGASSLMLSPGDTTDGFLSASELSTLNLRHTYLAVLSACQTSVGAKGQGGSDLSSIAGAFMGAGAPTVVGSLWNVSDESTTRLMLGFYREFLSAGAGDAMRRSKQALRADPRYQHPYYWSPFVTYGWDK